MGRVVVPAKIESIKDLMAVQDGKLAPDQVRTVEVAEAVADTGAMMLSLPKRLVAQLGLTPYRVRRIRTAGGTRDVNICGPVKLTVQGRDANVDVMEMDDDVPVLLGQVTLELLDFVVDPVNRRLIGNPEHGGQWMGDGF